MNFLADESVDKQVVEVLRHNNHLVTYIAEIDPSISDNAVFDRANEADAILLTADRFWRDRFPRWSFKFKRHCFASTRGLVLGEKGSDCGRGDR